MNYWTCPLCGANLDPGERCDCEARNEQQTTEQARKGGDDHDQRASQDQTGAVRRAAS